MNNGNVNTAPAPSPRPPTESYAATPSPKIQSMNSSTALPTVPKEVKLYNNTKERELYENMADLYSIIKTVEHLEKAYIRDSISAADYTPACSKLIAQYKTAQHLIKDTTDIQKFIADYRLDCKSAVDRLNKGYPATLEHPVTSSDPVPATKNVAETVQHFITAMDSLKLNLVSVDAIHPLLNDVMESLNKNPSLPADFEGKVKLKNWLTILNKMKASDELNEEQVRQLLFDLESSYNAFYKNI